MIFFQLFLFFIFFVLQCHSAAMGNIVKRENNNENNKNVVPKKEPKKFFFDRNGILNIDATVPGISEPIILDKNNKFKYCAVRQYFIFTFCPKDKRKMEQKHQVCPEGITFCYDGQLSPEYSRSTYALPTMQNEVSAKCKEFHGFKVSIQHLPKTTDFLANKHLFLEIKTSYMDQSYYFPMSDSRCMDLYMGNDNNLLTAIRIAEHDYQVEQPVQVVLSNGSKAGIHYESKQISADENEKARQRFVDDFTTLPETDNFERFRENAHLNMLYLDFKARYLTPQMMFTIAPEENCNMIIRVRSNTVGKCKSSFKLKNFALRSYGHGNSTTDYVLTLESGVEESKTQGKRRASKKTSTSANERGGSATDEEFQSHGMQREQENVQETNWEKSHEAGTKSEWGVGGSLSGELNAKKFSLSGKIGLDYTGDYGDMNKFTEFSNVRNQRMKSDTTTTSAMSMLELCFIKIPGDEPAGDETSYFVFKNSYRNTETASNAVGSKLFESETVGVSRRTIFKWIVKVPPKKVLTMQMQLNCDGDQVKIPWIKFVVTDEGEDLPVTEYDD